MPSDGTLPAGNGIVQLPTNSNLRLQSNPWQNHNPDSYEDLQSEFTPLLFSSLERYLPHNLLNAPRGTKHKYMREILRRYSNEGDRNRVQKHREYRERITSNYQPLYRSLYELNATTFFVPSFINAFMVNDNNRDERIKSIMSQPAPGVYAFDMLQPRFCEMLLPEVENFEKWICETNFKVMRPNTMNKFGAVLDDFGMDSMLDNLMEDFIRHISKLFFSDVGGYALDSHHGFVIQYGFNRDTDLGFHVDDSEVTLNVCLGKQFSGGELYFRGVRCDKHMNAEALPEEIFDYSHVPGHAIIHRGRHRRGARPTTAGQRVNLLLWCRSSVFRELRKHQTDFVSWCGECQQKMRERVHQAVTAKRVELFRGQEESAS
ncbi:putative oxoglutarate/iron-dependent dioxygenase [Helianthus annuus]|nr:putative oxoglutarate/iron-dependent dioxygenase [Helianthus annuus]KAJ0632563.1 putative oxoglutarate/iron-dependent dioxygenase [Helianthus annuus]KAJ0826466.1 putative oxoglutarate/iron-dependent dioxygenase [Helianthus annuus]